MKLMVCISLVIFMYSLFVSATVIIAVHEKVGVDYTKRLRKGPHDHNPFDHFSRTSQTRLICHAVVKAKQFIFTLKEEDTTQVSLISNPTQEIYKPQYKYQCVRPNKFLSKTKIKCLQCVHFSNALHWYMSFGLVNRFMFLVQPQNANAGQSFIRATAIVEPSALFYALEIDSLLRYFWAQVKSTQNSNEESQQPSNVEYSDIRPKLPNSMMTVCDLSLYDHVRLCGSAFETLSNKGYFETYIRQTNYIVTFYRCIEQHIITTKDPYSKIFIPARVMPCSINTHRWSPQFYVLADPQEHGSIFILLPDFQGGGGIKVTAKLGKIGALMNPGKMYVDEKKMKKRRRSN